MKKLDTLEKGIAYEKVFCNYTDRMYCSSYICYELLAFGLLHGGSGANVYEQSYGKVHAEDTTCTVTLSVKKGEHYYGSRTTYVGPGRTTMCYSNQVLGTGGTEAITLS